MMVISMELKARVARFSPKMIAGNICLGDSVTISNIGVLKTYFSRATLGLIRLN